ncbi:MAG: hypothetical protein N2053_11505 [Chitinispirillaceae bacterium]|nr:hypothetical protein [Chitinispirillaceae bacterium]
MLNANIYPRYREEDIEKIVQLLYDKNQKQIGDRICNLYLQKGIDFLRRIYESNLDL